MSGGNKNHIYTHFPILRFLLSSVFQRCWFSAILQTFPTFEETALMKLLGSLCLLVLCLGISCRRKTIAQAAAAPSASATPAAAQSAPATQTTQYTLPPDKLAKAKASVRSARQAADHRHRLFAPVLLGLLYLGIAGKFRDWAEAAGKNRFVQALIFVRCSCSPSPSLQLAAGCVSAEHQPAIWLVCPGLGIVVGRSAQGHAVSRW